MRQLLVSLLRYWSKQHPLPFRVVFWDGTAFDFAGSPLITVTISTPTIVQSFLTRGLTALGDAYASGDLVVEGAAEDIIRLGISLSEQLAVAGRLARAWNVIAFRHSRHNDAAAIRHHYDLSNEFYELWLDTNMIYSCAYFEEGKECIDIAQQNKISQICRKLCLQPGDYLLDVGCGWGGLLIEAALKHGVRGLGITNSEAQHTYASERVRCFGLMDKIELRLQDYRDISDTAAFDKIVSIGMYEHVGLCHLRQYFSQMARLLKPGGIFLNQGVIAVGAGGRPLGPPGGDFINRHVFPGGELPRLSSVLEHLEQCHLEVVDVEDLRPHYARTLLLWLRRLERNEASAKTIAGNRYPIWRIYLAGMAYAFDHGWLSSAQVLSYKGLADRPAPRPWSRANQLSFQQPAIASELNWSAS